MAAPIRLVGGITNSHPEHRERLAGVEPEIRLHVAVGKSDSLRPVPLTEADVIRLVSDGAAQLERLRRQREKS